MNKSEMSKIRNFSIIAHIDHGKSTLADRMLESTHTDLGRDKRTERILDRLELEQEKGITIKLQAVRMLWKDHELNLIDTPGHVDFSYEVSRSLAACDSAILLVDATQGVQAQTISVTKKALELGLTIIPVLNKVDVEGVDLNLREQELAALLKFKPEDIIRVSGKTGLNVDKLLDAIVEKTPCPVGDPNAPFKAMIFDSFYDEHRGVVVALRVFDGQYDHTHKRDKPLHILQKKELFNPTEVGIFSPDLKETGSIKTGEVGYMATGLKEIKYFTVGDTISGEENVEPLPGYQPPQPNVFATFFPSDTDDYQELKVGLGKLALNDAALTYNAQRSSMLGAGFRCGFLGLLHMEIVQERLEREYGVDLVITAPTVEYHITKTDGEKLVVQTPGEMPDPSQIDEINEPWVRTQILTPEKYMGAIMNLMTAKRGQYVNTTYLNTGSEIMGAVYVTLDYDMPLASLISDFYDTLKNLSSGYASMEYEFIDFFPVDMVKVSVLVNHEEVNALSFLETRDNARFRAAKLLEVMKNVISRQQFNIALQAAIGGKIIAREDIKSFSKDVTAKLYGGDITRRMKLWDKQKKGKKRLKQVGKVNIPQEAFLAILKT